MIKNKTIGKKPSKVYHQSVPGFVQRLNEALEFAGYRVYGRLRVVASYADITDSGVRRIFTQDRPPRSENLERIVDGLIRDIKDARDVTLDKDVLKNYLLFNKGTPIWIEEKNDGQMDPVFVGMAYSVVKHAGKNLGMDVIEHFDRSTLRKICEQVILYCKKRNIEPKSDNTELFDFVTSLLRVAAEQII